MELKKCIKIKMQIFLVLACDVKCLDRYITVSSLEICGGSSAVESELDLNSTVARVSAKMNVDNKNKVSPVLGLIDVPASYKLMGKMHLDFN
jgi:hypothetical protein